MGILLKKSTQHSIIWRWTVLCKKQDGGRIKICEIFCGKSLKVDLLIDTTFDPCYFSWDSPFKKNQNIPLKSLHIIYKQKLIFFLPCIRNYSTMKKKTGSR